MGTYPLLGVPAAINAFALGAIDQSPCPHFPSLDLPAGKPHSGGSSVRGIRVISNRDIPTPGGFYLHAGGYGTYLVEDSGRLTALASPLLPLGPVLGNVIRSILSGAWDQERDATKAVNYWWGLNSGVIDVKLADSIPPGLAVLAQMLRKGLKQGPSTPLPGPSGTKAAGHATADQGSFSPDTLLRMDWLCEMWTGKSPTMHTLPPWPSPWSGTGGPPGAGAAGKEEGL